MKVSFRETSTFPFADPSLAKEEAFVVWWYGPLLKNVRAGTVSKAIVFLRRIDEHGNLGQIIQRETALTHLGLLRIGSVWEGGVSSSIINYPVFDFNVSFLLEGWRSYSPREKRNEVPLPFANHEYPLIYSPDRNYLLEFNLADGNRLLIPSTEFFIRCYGRSVEIKRVLATYCWDVATTTLYKPIEGPFQPGTWPIKLAKRMRNDDAIFLAHVFYDSYARGAAKHVYSQIEAAFDAGERYAFLEATPWFQGTAQIRIAGIPLNGGHDFLGLRILGMNHPQGDPILCDRENPSTAKGANVFVSSNEEGVTGFPVKAFRKLPKIIDLIDDEEPDHGSSSLDIWEENFVTLGRPRTVVRVQRYGTQIGARRKTVTDDSTRWSAGEPRGNDKGIGYASIHAKAIMESQGVLRDMWNACLYFQKMRPEVAPFSPSVRFALDHDLSCVGT